MKKKFSKKQTAFVLVAICLVGLIGIGISYSYYLANISTSNEENKNSDISSATITKVVMDMQGKVFSDGAYPGHVAVKEVIVRGIGENNSIPANASIKITPDLGVFDNYVWWYLFKSDTSITCNSTVHKDGGQYYEDATYNIPESASLVLQGSSDSDYLNIVVSPNTETKYYLVVEYYNKDDEDQSNQMGKSFNVDIGLGEKITCPTVNDDGSIQVTRLKNEEDAYICSAPDTYGTSYYYRGKVTNNYVKFGKWNHDVYFGYYSDNSSWNQTYDSLEKCQEASEYNVNCRIGIYAGTPMYWRIIRINGDNTLRMIYDGTKAHPNREDSADHYIGRSAFNDYWKKDNVKETTNSDISYDNAGVGYMYGNRDAIVEPADYSFSTIFTNTDTYYIAKEYTYDATTDKFTLKDPIAVLGSAMTSDYVGYYTFDSTSATSSDSYVYKIFGVTAGDSSASVKLGYVRYGTSSKEAAQTNTNDSTIKAYLDNWYEANILGTENEQYLVDNIFCNDRLMNKDKPNDSYYHYINEGYGSNSSAYRCFFSEINSKLDALLTCPQKNDAFTVNNKKYGNGDLKYPIGLITVDEAALAGGTQSYLSTGDSWWTSSSSQFSYKSAVRCFSWGSGYKLNDCYVGYSDGLVRPVLNISKEVLNKGDGSMNNPYRIE